MGGGVYTAAKSRSRTLAVIGALLLFADYTVTASLSALEAFHYFGLPLHKHEQVDPSRAEATTPAANAAERDAGAKIDVHRQTPSSEADALFARDSPGLWRSSPSVRSACST